MNPNEVIAILRREKARLRDKYGLVKVGVFGSVARGEATAESDTDLVVEVPITNAWSYFELREELAQLVGGKVDIVRLRPGLRASLRRRIESEAIFA